MNSQTKSIEAGQLEAELLPLIEGTVFHVTPSAAFDQIQRTGFVMNNLGCKFPFTFPQSRRNWGRQKGYVSLFDLRNKTADEIEWTLTKFYFLNPSHCRNAPVFLILTTAACERVTPPPASMSALKYEYIWIPESEVFYPGDLPLTDIEMALRVNVFMKPDPPEVVAARNDAFQQAMRHILERRKRRAPAEDVGD